MSDYFDPNVHYETRKEPTMSNQRKPQHNFSKQEKLQELDRLWEELIPMLEEFETSKMPEPTEYSSNKHSIFDDCF